MSTTTTTSVRERRKTTSQIGRRRGRDTAGKTGGHVTWSVNTVRIWATVSTGNNEHQGVPWFQKSDTGMMGTATGRCSFQLTGLQQLYLTVSNYDL